MLYSALTTPYILVYDANGNFVTDLPILRRNLDDDQVSFVSALPDTVQFIAGQPYRFVVLANCTNQNYGISYKDGKPNLDALIYATPIQESIPMWGVKSYTMPRRIPESRTLDLGTINVLRAASKIGVRLSPDVKAEGYTIKSIALNYANVNGYCAPANWNKVDYTEALTHDQAYRATAGPLTTNVNAMARGAETSGYYIYVPETANNDPNFYPEGEDVTSQLSLAVTLTNDKGEDVEFSYADGIKFCYYRDGQPTDETFNLVRNHFYSYVITSVNVGLALSLEVADWEDEPVWDLDFSAPVHTMLLTSPQDGAPRPTSEPTLAYSNISDEKYAFEGYFKMESPAGVSWKPTLANASAGDYEVRVYTNGDTHPDIFDIPVTEPAIEASDNRFYKIVVVAKNANREGKVVKLGLTYTSSWNDENSLLIINRASDGGLYYPWVDNDPADSKDDPDIHWISIKQVSI